MRTMKMQCGICKEEFPLNTDHECKMLFGKLLSDMTMKELQDYHEGAMMGDSMTGEKIYEEQAILLEREMDRREVN